MAGVFPRHRQSCEGDGCDCGADFVYCVKENRLLCPKCAEDKRRDIVDRGDEPDSQVELMCRKHGEKVKYFCATHDVPACQVCATIHHMQPPCKLVDLMAQIESIQTDLLKAGDKLTETKDELETQMTSVDEHIARCDQHFRTLTKAITDVKKAEMKRAKDEQRRKDSLARRRAEEEIRRIKQRLEKELHRNQSEANNTYIAVRNKAESQLALLQSCYTKTQHMPRQISGYTTYKLRDVAQLHDEVNAALLSNKLLLFKGRQLAKKAEESAKADQTSSNILDNLNQIVRRLSVGEEASGAKGCLSGTEGEWCRTHIINIKEDIRLPLLAGSTSEKDLVVTDVMRISLHVVDVKCGSVQPIIPKGALACVSDCAVLQNGTVVCGNFGSVSLCFFSGSWKHKKEIRLLDDHSATRDPVHFDIDARGNILAVVFGRPEIVVIGPAGNIKDTICCRSCRTILDIHTLASGDVIIQSAINKFIIYDQDWVEKKRIHRSHWESARCTVDKTTNLLYIMYKEFGKAVYAVDVLLPEGEVFSEKNLEIVPSPRRADSTPKCHCLGYGKLAICDGEQIFVFEKTLGVEDVRALERSVKVPLQAPQIGNVILTNGNLLVNEIYV